MRSMCVPVSKLSSSRKRSLAAYLVRTRLATSRWRKAVLVRSALSTTSSSWPRSGFTNTVACRRSGDIRTSVTLTRCDCNVSSWTSPRASTSLSTWRTCSPTRSSRTLRPSGVSVWRISCFRYAALERARPFLDLEHLEIVARLDVVGVGQQHAAFEARRDLGDVVLEAAERRDRRLRDDHVLARQSGVKALANIAFQHQQAGRLVALAGREHFLNLGAAD